MSIVDAIRAFFRRRGSSPTALVPTAPSLDALDRTGQRILCDVEPASSPPRLATLGQVVAATGVKDYVPAAYVAQKAKSVCDGILAALEGLSTEGDDRGVGMNEFLRLLAAASAPSDTSRDFVDAAVELANGVAAPGTRAKTFLKDPVRSKPLGFYTWSESLERVFRRDRFLGEVLDKGDAAALAASIASDVRLRAEYVRRLRRVSRLTNPFAVSSLMWRLSASPPRLPADKESLFPPSAAPENGYASVADFDAVKSGRCDLKPTDNAGFYAHQLYALTALLSYDRTPEAHWRRVSPDYATALERFAAAVLFQARESHVKQVAMGIPGMPSARPRYLTPGLTIEPLPTFYTLTAEAFRFLRTVVEDGWGRRVLEVRQLRESGSAETTIGVGIDDVVGLCESAAKLSFLEIKGEANGAEVDAMRERLMRLTTDPDVTCDARGMVPLGFGDDPTQIRALVFAGWDVHNLIAKLTCVDAELPVGVELGAEAHPLPIPLVREMLVPPHGLLNRTEVRALCIRALETAPPALAWAHSQATALAAELE